eukprot:TRINITY_DN15434_c0_g1_i2.p1 TRINITY_DN15434_c0_g1~~TRINITY_DN15434_c0_g1_i2.p1  ORF type:complete len:296 (-),score=82.23 TRINITY_DN15434_c0_g1_i2:183-1070(-)
MASDFEAEASAWTEEEDSSPSAGPSQWHTPRQTPRSVTDGVPQSPSHGVFLAQPASIDEPLLLLDEEETQDRREAERVALNEELEEARRSGKVDRAAVEAMGVSVEELKRESDRMLVERQRMEQEISVLRLQLENHHGIMAADWAQTLGFQERLRQEEAEAERLSREVAELRAALAAREDENASLRTDAACWRLLGQESLEEVSSDELEHVLEVALHGIAGLQAESRVRSRTSRCQLRDELEQQLCAVCRDAKKEVLFLPCQHLCVCEGCRVKLRPYRCPMCQVPVQSHIGRVHF